MKYVDCYICTQTGIIQIPIELLVGPDVGISYLTEKATKVRTKGKFSLIFHYRWLGSIS